MMSGGTQSAEAQTFNFVDGYGGFSTLTTNYNYSYSAGFNYNYAFGYAGAYTGGLTQSTPSGLGLSYGYTGPSFVFSLSYSQPDPDLLYTANLTVAYVQFAQPTTVYAYWNLTSSVGLLNIYDFGSGNLEYQYGAGNSGYSYVTLPANELIGIAVRSAVIGTGGGLELAFVFIPAPAALPVFGLAAMATAGRRRRRE